MSETVKIINKSKNPLPAYQTSGAAGVDVQADFSVIHNNPDELIGHLCAYDEVIKAVCIWPGGRALIPTELYMELPSNMEAQVRPRSGLALKKGVTVLNTPGTIDEDYRGNIGVILINHGPEAVYIEEGERIAQIVFNKVEKPELIAVDSLSETDRGEGGFGHTGK